MADRQIESDVEVNGSSIEWTRRKEGVINVNCSYLNSRTQDMDYVMASLNFSNVQLIIAVTTQSGRSGIYTVDNKN